MWELQICVDTLAAPEPDQRAYQTPVCATSVQEQRGREGIPAPRGAARGGKSGLVRRLSVLRALCTLPPVQAAEEAQKHAGKSKLELEQASALRA